MPTPPERVAIEPLPRKIRYQGVFGSLKTQLRWSYALVSVIPLTLLGALLIAFGLWAQRENIAQEQQTTANWIAREIATSLSAVDERLLQIGQLVGPPRTDAEALEAIRELREMAPEIIDIAVLDETGRERLHVSQLRGFYDSELIDRSDDELVRWTLQTGRFAQGPIVQQRDGILIYPSYAPILSNAGQVIGAIRVEVRLDQIARTLHEAPLQRGSVPYLVNSDGELLFARYESTSRPPAALAALLETESTSQEYVTRDGTVVVGAWSAVPVQPAPWWVVVEIPRALAYAPVQRDSLLLIGAVLLVIVTTIGWGRYEARQILHPIEELRAGAMQIGAGDLAARIPIRGHNEIGELADEFNRMAERLHRSREEIEGQNERLRAGLALARDIQLGLLPTRPPDMRHGPAVQAHSIPAYEVGGDFYSYLALDDHRMAIAIGDISGKGVGAALMMALASSSVEALGRGIDRPAQLLSALNEQLISRLRANNMNAAVLYMIVDTERSLLRVANAGMIAPLLLRDGRVTMIDAFGLPLGMLPEARYTEITVDLLPGDVILLVSDGVVEAHRPDGELFSFERLEQTLIEHRGTLPPGDLIATLLQRVTEFMAGAEQHDDMTIVVVHPNLSPVASDPHEAPVVEELVA